jgi:hypothetical protein
MRAESALQQGHNAFPRFRMAASNDAIQLCVAESYQRKLNGELTRTALLSRVIGVRNAVNAR